MFHENLEADIVRKDGLPRSARRGTIHGSRHVGGGRVQF